MSFMLSLDVNVPCGINVFSSPPTSIIEVGELNGFMALGKYTNKSLNDLTYGFVKAENCSNGPEGTFTGIVRTYSPDNYVIAQVAIDTSGDMSIRVNWDGWRGWRKNAFGK